MLSEEFNRQYQTLYDAQYCTSMMMLSIIIVSSFVVAYELINLYLESIISPGRFGVVSIYRKKEFHTIVRLW